ncbi:ribosomal large subunit pseudouridine synthase B [Mycoplasmopsis canis UF31]|uniref:pseudouridine synthase n=1 Tax=Mycoplasmopsis canis TaxID=29555 RepID=UPI00025AD9EE|nr:pseudouridine synthase [Mycoplasmopsis canis]EIE39662.1 ribosomal large subunit pseudouridine synthase B [Mycoplasmopsis canis UF31]EIE41298.1 ribosomal large subunit pseudouridine synthase B [Mycoplasmopsis canis UFG1]
MEKERIQKLLSMSGVASRREAESFILQGRVKVNGVVAKLGDKASYSDEILFDNKPINPEEEKVYFVLNKPPKTICSLKDHLGRTLVTDLISTPFKIFPVGRLDYDTTGVLILTNDGDLSNKLLHPKYKIFRVYRARLNEPLSKNELKALNGVVVVNNVESHQDVIPAGEDSPKSYLVVLSMGTYHHVKELFKTVNKTVLNLKRIEYAGITVEKMPLGSYRKLTFKEVKNLKHLVRVQEEELKKSK